MRLIETSLLYKEASALEETSPKGALKTYNRLESLNKPFATRIFLPAAICPIIASFVNYGVSELVDGHRTWVAILMLIAVGFVPPLIIYERKFEQLKAQHSRLSIRYYVIIGSALVYAVVLSFGQLIVAIVVGFYTFIFTFPILLLIYFLIGLYSFLYLNGTPYYWLDLYTGLPIYVTMPVINIFFVIFYLACITGIFLNGSIDMVPFRLPYYVKRIPVAIRPMAGEILSFFTIAAVGYAVYGTGFDIPYGYSWAGLIENSFAGIMLGLYYARRLEKDFIFGNVLRIAKIRCLIRLGREDEARYILRRVTKDYDYPPKFSRTPVVKHLGNALGYFIADQDCYRRQRGLPSNQPVFEDVASNRATEGLSSRWVAYDDRPPVDYPYNEVSEAAMSLETAQPKYIDTYVDSIDKTRRFIGLGNDQSIEKLIRVSLRSL